MFDEKKNSHVIVVKGMRDNSTNGMHKIASNIKKTSSCFHVNVVDSYKAS
jgi:hypothetical protein